MHNSMDTDRVSIQVNNMLKKAFDKSEINIYQTTSGFFTVFCDGRTSEERLFEHQTYGKPPHKIKLPNRDYYISGFPSYANLKKQVEISQPEVILLHDLALKDLEYEPDLSNPASTIASAISKIKNSDAEKDEIAMYNNIQKAVHELSALTENRQTIILLSLFDNHPGLIEHLTNEYSRVSVGKLWDDFLKDKYALLNGDKGVTTKEVCKKLEKMILMQRT